MRETLVIMSLLIAELFVIILVANLLTKIV